jgi:hypothetical protein
MARPEHSSKANPMQAFIDQEHPCDDQRTRQKRDQSLLLPLTNFGDRLTTRLAPDQRREAVATLNEKPILALTLRLPWQGFAMRCGYPFVKMVEREGIEPSTPAL